MFSTQQEGVVTTEGATTTTTTTTTTTAAAAASSKDSSMQQQQQQPALHQSLSEDGGTTCEADTVCEDERAARSRSCSDQSSFEEQTVLPTTATTTTTTCLLSLDVNTQNSTMTECDDIDPPCTPTIAPLHPSLAGMSLSSVGEVSEEELQPPAVTPLPMHRTKTTSDLFAPARGFSTLSAPQTMQQMCICHIPGWDHLTVDDIMVDQILSGLSNQLFKVFIREDYVDRPRFANPNVLFRIYGKDVNSLYDSATEVKVFKKLGVRGVAPTLIAEFEGGRIEEWIEGSALLVSDMAKPSVLIGTAAILAGIHQIDLSKYISTAPCIDKFLSLWREGAMAIYNSMEEDHPSYLPTRRLDLPTFYQESFKLRELLFPEGVPENEVTKLSFCHNDTQENNIMVTSTCMRLIDFEYSGYNYPAFDIASFFWEMSCDYCVDTYPFFRIDPTKYPLVEKRKLFCAMYLSKLTRTTVKTSYSERLDPVLDAVERFQLACHMLWGFWSVIRAPQAATATQFDMLHYAQKRIDAYWAQKAKLIAEGKLARH